MSDGLPSVSVLIPTLNSARTLADCLEAVSRQDYPRELIEIIVADGGSSDATVAIAESFGARVVENPRKTGESGKAVALQNASRDVVAFIDSDNILVGNDWMIRMVAPFSECNVAGTEPLSFFANPGDSIIDRYCALAGVNDPLCLFTGNYDRESAITGRWTNLNLETEERGDYFTFSLVQDLPTIGANGTTYRRSCLDWFSGNYFMDIDVPMLLARHHPEARFAKVRTSIRHLYCRDSAQFRLKQTRRVRDFFESGKSNSGERVYPWRRYARRGIIKFIVLTVAVFPLVGQALRAYYVTHDRAALFHPVACWMTLWVYGANFIFARGKGLSRDRWQAKLQ